MKRLLLVFVLVMIVASVMAIPKLRATNGRAYAIEEYLEKNANDPKSIEYVENSVLIEYSNGMYCQLVRFRGKNGFGGLVLKEYIFTISGDDFSAKVVAMDTPADMEKFIRSQGLTVKAKYGANGVRLGR